MRKATVTQEEVNAAADRLLASGTKPTARAVHEEIGRGSMATVLRLLQNWLSAQGQAHETQAALPAALQRVLMDFIAQEVASAKLSLEQNLVNSQLAQNDLIDENERLSAEIEELKTDLNELKSSHQQLEGRCAQLTTDLENARQAAETQRQAGEHARTEVAKLLLRLEGVPRLESELAKLKEDLDAERKLRVAAEQSAAVAVAIREQSEYWAADLKDRLAKAETELHELRTINRP